MAILNGTIDKVLEEERKNMDKYLKGAMPLKIELLEIDGKILKGADKIQEEKR